MGHSYTSSHTTVDRPSLGKDVAGDVDEGAEGTNSVAALAGPRSPLAVLVAPEGGFAEDERASLMKLAERGAAVAWSADRADTAAVAALALIQALVGDWSLPA